MLEKGQEGWRFDLDVGGGDCGGSDSDPGLEEVLCIPHLVQPIVELWLLATPRVSAVVVLPEPGATANHYHNNNNNNNKSEREDKREEGGVT